MKIIEQNIQEIQEIINKLSEIKIKHGNTEDLEKMELEYMDVLKKHYLFRINLKNEIYLCKSNLIFNRR